MHRFFIIYSATIITSLLAFLGYSYLYLAESQWIELGSETGAFERLSAVTFAFISAFVFYMFYQTKEKIHFIFASLMALASMREMGLHRAWTTDSILKLRFYTGDDAPLLEKIIGVVVIMFIIYAGFQMLKKLPYWIGSLLKFNPMAWMIGFGLGLLTFAKLIDSMSRVLPFLANFHTENRSFLTVIEEGMEMTAALFFAGVAIMVFKTNQQRRQGQPQ